MRCSHRDPAVRAHQQETQTWARHVALLPGQLPPGYPGRLETSTLLPPSYHLQNPLPSSSQWARLPPRPLLLGTPVTLMAMTQDPTASRAHVVRSPGGMPSSIILPTTVSPVEPTVPGPAPHPVPGTSHHQYPPTCASAGWESLTQVARSPCGVNNTVTGSCSCTWTLENRGHGL